MHNRRDGTAFAFEDDAWSCASCGPKKARRVRGGIYRAAFERALTDHLTVTLPAEWHVKDPEASRKALAVRWNRFRTRMRALVICARGINRGALWRCGKVWKRDKHHPDCPACGCPDYMAFMPDYVSVPEWHKDDTAHAQVAINIAGLRAALNQDYRAIEAWLQAAWTKAGGGFIWWTAGDSKRGPRKAAAYISKYLSKMQVKTPPWDFRRYETVGGGVRRRPWHRWSATRAAARIINPPRKPATPATPPDMGLMWKTPGGLELDFPLLMYSREKEWELARPVFKNGEIVGYDPVPPFQGLKIIPACLEAGGHDIRELTWVCHHDADSDAPWCFCDPPWAMDIVREAELDPRGYAHELVFRYRRHVELLGAELDEEVEQYRREFYPTPAELDPTEWTGRLGRDRGSWGRGRGG